MRFGSGGCFGTSNQEVAGVFRNNNQYRVKFQGKDEEIWHNEKFIPEFLRQYFDSTGSVSVNRSLNKSHSDVLFPVPSGCVFGKASSH